MFWSFRKKHHLTEEQLKWNSMWDLWAAGKIQSPYQELMRYQSEINNGGHSQYFTNLENGGNIEAEMAALNQLLPQELKSNLQKAYQAYLIPEENDESAEETLELCDDVFYENEREITDLLEAFSKTTGF